METIDVSAPIEVFLLRHSNLPHELQHALRDKYTDLPAFAIAALDPRWTTSLFAHFEALFTDVCARWSQSDQFVLALSAFGRIVPFAPHLGEYATLFLQRNKEQLRSIWKIQDDRSLVQVLLALFRLLVANQDVFRKHVPLEILYEGLKHENEPVRYLIIRIVSVYLKAADAMTESYIRQYLGEQPLIAAWDDLDIDYAFLSLWEEKSWKDVDAERKKVASHLAELPAPQVQKFVRTDDLSPLTVAIFGNIMPRSNATASTKHNPSLIPVSTTSSNAQRFTRALLQDPPVLLTGMAGSGKTSIITYCAQKLNKHESMVTLHLNEQSDAKMLVGMYTSGTTPGTFVWQAGVLTTAVREGRWLLIEDLDRAPNEIISVLLPLIERQELTIPSRGETIKAAQGFKIIATMRTNRDLSGNETLPKRNMIGHRFWNRVQIDMLTHVELKEVILGRFSNLHAHAGQITAVYTALQDLAQKSRFAALVKSGSARPLTPRDLFKWCQRLHRSFSRSKSFSDAQLDEMFLEAIDCFAGHLAQGEVLDLLAATIAERLHIDAARRDHLIQSRTIKLATGTKGLSIGRITLRQSNKARTPLRQHSFAHSPHSLRLLEKLAVAVDSKEPVLLVGETGIGKTTCIQHLATTMSQKLISFNLSQQSESGDLLGGFKPVNVRGLIMPLREEFDELFSHPLSPFAKRKDDNQHFVDMLGKALAKGQWKKICLMWKSAAGEVLKSFGRSNTPKSPRASEGHHSSKRRRTEDLNGANDEGSHAFYQARWNKFAADIKDLESHLASKSSAFAFKFVEGSLVKAVRNGHWVLLDEINLATPDTLEALVDLLGSSFGEEPSLLLTESGNIERVTAHPDFRVFAAMNPATDIGKKDLPPGIRSRFTELYVDSPDRDVKSLQHIVASYLPDELGPRIVADVTNLYVDVQKLAEGNSLVDGAGQKPHFSLRTLTRTLAYARDVAAPAGAKDAIYRRALYEGFHMSFSTLLDAASEALIAPKITHHLFAKLPNAKSELKKPLPKPADGRTYVQEGQYWLHKGAFEPQKQPHYIITPFVQRNLNNLIRAISTRKLPILIQGPTSSGKTSMVEYLAKKSGNKFMRINNHEHTDLQEYLGTYVSGADGQLRFQEGILVEALRKGYWIVLDELNLAPTDVLEALNRLLDDNRELLIPETQEVVTPHQDFMLFATQNPAGLYGGRKHLSRAFRNRFLELHFDDIPVSELCEILQQRTQIPPSWAQRIVDTYKELSSLRQENRMFEQKSFATLRDLFRWAMRGAETKEQLAINGFMLLAERVRKPEEREKVRQIMEEVMSRNGPNVKIDEHVLYDSHAQDIAVYRSQAEAGSKGVVWTKSMRRLYVLVANAIRNNEPILLVGETGCGKTTVCQMLADALRKELFVVNAHQNTETGDLIGSQRPVRNRSAIEAKLAQVLRDALLNAPADATLDDLWTAFSALPETNKASVPIELIPHIQELRAKSQALFEWSDGSLVHAMKTGQLFLLDEISLADDSVLERLNSVLEPSRTLLLAEKGATADASVTAIDGFQFLATMNPGGDYGKRELSPALRNRFTEIWVPSLYDLDDISEIIRAKLVPQAAEHAKAIVCFSSWFNERYNSSAAAAISIRDTLAWIEFVNRFVSSDTTSAILHGAAMVYIDTLGANPAAMLSISMSAIDEERSKCVAELGRLLHRDVTGDYFSIPELVVSDDELVLGKFTLPRMTTGAQDPAFTFSAATTRVNAMRVFRALQLTKPLLIEGSPGVGKTTLVTAVAKAVGKKLVRINLSEQTDLMDLFGSDVPVEGSSVGTFAWRDAPFLSAMKNGDWVLLDEMNLASQSVLEGLNACLDHRAEAYIAELDQTFSRHRNFRLFAAQNPHQQGGGRKGLPASFVNRFTVVYADVFKQEDLNLICKQIFPDVSYERIADLTRFVDNLEQSVVQRHRFGALGNPWEFNLRDTIRWLQLQTKPDSLLSAGRVYDFCDLIFRQRFRSQSDREQLDALFTDTFKVEVGHRSFYHILSSDSYQVGLGSICRTLACSSATPKMPSLPVSHLPTLEALMICVELSWPILLTGASGSGKTSLLSHLAAVAGRRLLTFSMNADVDAMDLVGGYEQADPSRKRAELVTKITSILSELILAATKQEPNAALRLLQSVPPSLWEGKLDNHDATSLVAAVAAANAPIFADLLTCLHTLLELPEQIAKAQFEWVDGLLVTALQRGDWLVLDNANLCSSSVLDRLNSLLEPNGYLSINEHPTEDGEPQLMRPHPDFRIFFTMDPRNGELSRAMRNRSIELYLLHDSEHDLMQLSTTYGLEAAMSRYRNVITIAQPHIIDHATDHLSFEDLALQHRFASQVQAGLISDTSLQEQALQSFDLISKLDPEWMSQSMRASSASTVALGTGVKQSMHPLNNEIIVRHRVSLTSSPTFSAHPTRLARLYAVLMDLGRMTNSLGAATANAGERRPVTAFDRSLRQKSFHGGRLEDTIRVAPFLEQSLELLKNYVSSIMTNETMSEDVFNVLKAARYFWWDLFTLVTQATLDNASYQVLVRLGQQAINDSKFSDKPSLVLLEAQANLLRELSTGTTLSSGLHMDVLWTTFRPGLIPSLSRLQAYDQLKGLAEKFDRMVFPLRLPLDALAKTQEQLRCALGAILVGDVSVDALVSEMSAAMPTANDAEYTTSNSAIFRAEFEALYQYLHETASSATRSKLTILSGRPTAEGDGAKMDASTARPIQFTLSRLSSVGEHVMTQPTPGALLGDLPTSLISQLQSIGKVPLSELAQLRTELEFMSTVMADNAQLLCADQAMLVSSSLEQHLGAWQDSEISAVLSSALNPQELGSAQELGYALSKYATSCLNAYVPDRAFDPALKEQIQRQLKIARRTTSHNTIQALQDFEAFFSGQDHNMRIALATQEAQELNTEKAQLLIARPPTTRLNELQGDFNRIIEIVRRVEIGLAQSTFATDESLMQNITLLTKRLTENYMAYRDIVSPAVQWLRCLYLGLTFLRQAEVQSLASEVKASSWQLLRRLASAQSVEELPATTKTLAGMRFVALGENIDDSRRLFKDVAWDFFEDIFVTWKDKMSLEQAKHAKKSSLYVYRGDEQEQDNIDEDEYLELFPDYDNPDQKNREHDISTTRETAIRIADLHDEIFCGQIDLTQYFLGLLKSSVGDTSGSPSQQMIHSLPTMFLELQDKLQVINQPSIDTSRYDFYREPNMSEAARLAHLTQRVLRKYEELQAMDFEHATLDDVVVLATEVLSFAHTEPVAKFLTKAEKLYGAMYEWEKVAHKGLSAASLLAELTDLLVAWRRLELSTWMQLFAMEQRKADADAKSWWFVAYENIIANPRRLSKDDIVLHASELLKALDLFFRSATLGQFQQRLRILRQFDAHISKCLKLAPDLMPICSALRNFISYYARFEKPVADSLLSQRQQLEKQAKEIVQLASWRDTNIEALKQSAQTSHRRLFKLVRKFRAVLNRPISFIIESGPPEENTLTQEVLPHFADQLPNDAIRSASSTCQTMPTWSLVPARFTNTASTTQLMRKLAAMPVGFAPAEHITEFLSGTRDSMRELQQATPSLLTDENQEAVKHLKTRKRTLLADVLKSLRQMGFQYNLSVPILEQQDSTAAVLASLPVNERKNETFVSAEYEFHKTLSLMPQVRGILREHSGDLTPAEVQRSCGYLEGILNVIIQQRRLLTPMIDNTMELQKLSDRVFSLWDSATASPKILLNHPSQQMLSGEKRQVAWLLQIVSVLSKILMIQGALGVSDRTNREPELAKIIEDLERLQHDMQQLPDMPDGLSLNDHQQAYDRFKALKADVHRQLEMWTTERSTCGPVLALLEPWINGSLDDSVRGLNGHSALVSSTKIMTKVTSALDTILTSIQAMKSMWEDAPTPGARNGWLTILNGRLTSGLHTLNSSIVITQISDCFEGLSAVSEAERPLAACLIIVLQPAIREYGKIVRSYTSQLSDLHLSICQLAHFLSKSFIELGTKGFCTPADKTAGEAESGQEQKLEGGTGLGDGEGAADISEDIGDDEDLTELAQEPDQNKDGDEIEDEKDAVDMADEDMEGQLGETGEQGEDDQNPKHGDEQGEEPEEEMGSVDDLGAEAIDEKMWDEGGSEKEGEEKQADKSQGHNNDDQMAAQAKKEAGKEDEVDEDEEAEGGAQENEALAQQQGEQVDDYTEQADKLDLPEDLNMDAVEDKSDDESMDGLDDLDNDRSAEDIDMRDVPDDPTEDDLAEDLDAPVDTTQEEPDSSNDTDEEDQPGDDKQDQSEQEDHALDQDFTRDNVLQQPESDANVAEEAVPSDVQGMGTDANEKDKDTSAFNSNAKQDQGEQGEEAEEPGGASGEQGSRADANRQDAVGRSEDLIESTESQPFKKLGDALEKWFNQNRQIQRPPAEQDHSTREQKLDADMANVDFEHLLNEESQAEAQALGTATEDQARALNEDNAVASNEQELPQKSFMEEEEQDIDARNQIAEDTEMEDAMEKEDAELANAETSGQAKAFIGDRQAQDTQHGQQEEFSDCEDEIGTHDTPTADNISDELRAVSISNTDARALWTQNELKTRTLAATLTEQLRLILAPTLATKLRGDFRTGKRLNIKRIIPYIASSYKRDKIWMRRSVPSKRAYQIMLAVDDSKSMAEHGKRELAYETLALVMKALSMLEAGELCVAGFGENVKIAHAFDKPFTDDAGVDIFSKLSFDQGDTDVRKLVGDGISIFQEARARASSSAQDLWQLMLIVSDAICRDSDSIKRLVREAQGEKIMIVFVVVDAGAKEVDGRQIGSIMDLQGAEFKDGQVTMYKYMDVFPFKWWVVVRDVRELPGVLSMALRQWFAEVVDTSG